uniref:Vitellogenin domain-containing protein n=1 Tax=Trichuris muris TaxID=70415 RepID=A0A5S6Q845_TRIMR
MKARILYFALFLRLHLESYAKTHGDACFAECSGKDHKLHFDRGYRYAYDWRLKTKVAYNGTDKSPEVLEHGLRGKVHLYAMAPCEFTMKVVSAEQTAVGATQLDLEVLEKYTTQFSFDNGAVRSICPDPVEPIWSVNIKRGILSALQNLYDTTTLENDVEEADVSGLCPTEYKVLTMGNPLIVTRTKNLNACQHRGHGSFGRTVPYKSRSNYQTVPLFSGEQTCRQEIRNKILHSAFCEETNTFAPAYTEARGGLFVFAEMELSYVDSAVESMPTESGNQQPLYFDHSDQAREMSAEAVSQLNSLLPKFCASSSEVLRDTPDLFSELVHALSRVTRTDIESIWNRAESQHQCDAQLNYIADGLSACGSASCVAFIIDHLSRRQQTEEQRKRWLDSLIFIDNPTLDVVSSLTPLIQTSEKEELFRLSNVIHRYCQHDSHCASHSEVNLALDALSRHLISGCHPRSAEDFDKMLFALRAVGNVGVPTAGLQSQLNCLSDKTATVELRLAAVQSLRRLPCHTSANTALFALLNDQSESVEVRISAFMVLTKCLTDGTIDRILTLLKTETSMQVGSFIWSYFDSVKKSNSPSQRHLRHLLMLKTVEQRIDLDSRKFSRHTQFSTYSTHGNMGLDFEQSIIFSPDEYIPRQALLNLTMHIYGQSVNFLEIGARTVGLDSLVEHLFGPDGYFTNPEGHYFKEPISAHSNPKIRTLTSKFQRHLKTKENFDLSVYARIFGDDVFYYSGRDMDAKHFVRESATIENLMRQLAKERHFEKKRSIVFADWRYALPTIGGLPLQFNLNGVASVNVALTGKLDVKDLLKGKTDVDIKADVKGSVAARTAAMVSILPGKSRFGMSIKTRFFANRAVQLAAILKGGKSLHLKFVLPKEEIDLLRVESETFVVRGNEWKSLYPPEASGHPKHMCSNQAVNEWLGFKVCYSQKLPAKLNSLQALFTGPTLMRLSLKNNVHGPHAYEMLVTWKMTPSEKRVHVKAENSDYTADFVYYPKGELLAEVKSYKKPMNLRINAEYTSEKKLANFTFHADKKEIFSGHAYLKKKAATPLESAVELDLSISAHHVRKVLLHYDHQHKSPRTGRQPRSLEWRYGSRRRRDESEDEMYLLNLILESPWRNLSLSGKLDSSPQVSLMALTANYERDGKEDATTLKAEYRRSVQGQHAFIVLTSSLDFSKYPERHTEFSFKASNISSALSAEVHLISGQRTMSFLGSAKKDAADGTYSAEGKIGGNVLSGEHLVTGTYRNRLPGLFSFGAQVQGPNIGTAAYEIKYSKQVQTLSRVEIESKARYGSKVLEFISTVSEVEPNIYDVAAELKSPERNYVTVNGKALVKVRSAEKFNCSVNSVVKILDQPDLTLVKSIHRDGWDILVDSVLSDAASELYHVVVKAVPKADGAYEGHLSVTSQVGNPVDLSVDGQWTPVDNGHVSILKVRNLGHEAMKMELVIPKSFKHKFSQVKAHLISNWRGVHRRFIMDYMITRSAVTTHSFNLEGQLLQHNHYVNVKFTKAKVSQLTVKVGSGGSIDVLLHANYSVQPSTNAVLITALASSLAEKDCSWTGNITFEKNANGHLVHAELKNINNKNSRIALQYSSRMDVGDKFRRTSLLAHLKHRGLRFEVMDEFWRQVQKQNFTNKLTITWNKNSPANPDKRFANDLHVCMSPFAVSAETAFRSSDKDAVRSSLLLGIRSDQFDASAKLDLANKSVFDLNGMYKLRGRHEVFQGNLTSQMDDSYNIGVHLSRDKTLSGSFSAELTFSGRNVVKVHRRLETNSEGNRVQRLSFEHHDKGELVRYLTTTLETQMPAQLQKFDIAFKSGTTDYLAHGVYSAKDKSGTIQIRKSKEAAALSDGKLAELGPNEYTSLLTGAQLAGEVEIKVNAHADRQSVKIDVRKVDTPFTLEAESHWQASKTLIRAIVIQRDTGGRETFKSGFGLTVQTPKAHSATIDAELLRSDGDVLIHLSYVNERPALLDFKFLVNPARPSREQWTGFTIVHRLESSEKHIFKISLIDPKISDHVYLVANWQLSGDCRLLKPQSCHITVDSELSYSTDKNRLVKSTFNFKRETSVEGLWSMDGGIQNAFTNLNLHCYHKYKYRKCKNSGVWCEREVEWIVERLDEGGQLKRYELSYGEHRGQSAQLKAKCNDGEWVLQAHKQEQGYKVNILRDGAFKYTLTCTYAREEWLAKCQIENPHTILLHGYAHLITKEWLTAGVWHSKSTGERINDVDMSSKIEANDILTTRVYIRPDIKPSVQKWMRGIDLKDRLNSYLSGTFKTYGLLTKVNLIAADQVEHLAAVREQWLKEFSKLANDHGAAVRELTRVREEARSWLKGAGNELSDVLNEMRRRVAETISQVQSCIDGRIQSALDGWDSIRTLVKEQKESLSQLQNDVREHFRQMYHRLRLAQLEGALNEFAETFKVNIIRPLSDYFSDVRKGISPILDKIQQAIQISDWLNYSPFGRQDSVFALSDDVLMTIRSATSPAKLGELTKATRELFRTLRRKLEVQFWKMVPHFEEEPHRPAHYVIRLPFWLRMENIDDIARLFEGDNFYNYMYNMGQDLVELPMLIERLWHVGHIQVKLYKKPAGRSSLLYPPAIALLFGDSHYITFDSSSFDFVGKCTYLLARDFMEGRFSIWVDHDKHGGHHQRRSLTIEYINTMVAINFDGKVKVDGQYVHLPWIKESEYGTIDLSIVATSEHEITVKTGDGIEVNCCLDHRVCMIALPKWYHGKSAGLLGINDNEPHNDQTEPDFSVLREVERFAHKWSISMDCPEMPLAGRKDASVTSALKLSQCKTLFLSEFSPFRQCFYYVRPEPFYEICLAEGLKKRSTANEKHEEQFSCSISAAYLMVCQKHGIHLSLPSSCAHCEIAGRHVSEEEKVKLETQSSAMDVVFLVEEGSCLSERKELLKTFVRDATEQMNIAIEQEPNRVRYSIFGYNGQNVHKALHRHIYQSSFRMTSQELPAAIDHLSSSPNADNITYDPLNVLEDLVKLHPFRLQTAKVVVVVPCSLSTAEKAQFFNVRSMFIEHQVHVHLLTLEQVKLDKGFNRKIHGADAANVFAEDGAKVKDLRPYYASPHDPVSVLAMQTNGTVLTLQPESARIAASVLAQKLHSLSEQSLCQVCACTTVGMKSSPVCYPCVLNFHLQLLESGFISNPYIKLEAA